MRTVEAYISNKGNTYLDKEACAKEDNLVKCKLCNGSGNEKYTYNKPYPSGLPDSGWVPDEIIWDSRKCTRCSGIGYTAYNIEDDKDYQTYLKLKEKFGDKNDK